MQYCVYDNIETRINQTHLFPGLMNRTTLVAEGVADIAETQQFKDKQLCGTPEYVILFYLSIYLICYRQLTEFEIILEGWNEKSSEE